MMAAIEKEMGRSGQGNSRKPGEAKMLREQVLAVITDDIPREADAESDKNADRTDNNQL
jgi:hypothetical protein